MSNVQPWILYTLNEQGQYISKEFKEDDTQEVYLYSFKNGVFQKWKGSLVPKIRGRFAFSYGITTYIVSNYEDNISNDKLWLTKENDSQAIEHFRKIKMYELEELERRENACKTYINYLDKLEGDNKK